MKRLILILVFVVLFVGGIAAAATVTEYHVWSATTTVKAKGSRVVTMSGTITDQDEVPDPVTVTITTPATTTVPPTTTAPPAGEPAPISGQGYTVRFQDNFDALDRAVWDDHIWYDDAPRAGWSGFQTVENGVLHLRTSRSFFWGTGANDNYPINTVTTQTSGLTFTQGYFEARMKWTGGRGAWPGFWLLSYRHATNPSWPSVNSYCPSNGVPDALCYAAELDAFEGQGVEPTTFYGTVHRNSCGCYGVGDSQNDINTSDAGVDLTADFHTYGMLWTTTAIRWYLDDRLLHSAPVYDSTNQPMFLLLQMWVGGWMGNPDSTTPDVLETQVDYVRVWQR